MYIFDPLEVRINLLEFSSDSSDSSDVAGNCVGLYVALAGNPF